MGRVPLASASSSPAARREAPSPRPAWGAATALVASLGAALALPPPASSGASGDGLLVLRPRPPQEVLVRAGSFLMGSSAAEVAEALAICRAEPAGDACEEQLFAPEYPAHEVFLDDFWMDRTEVTVEAYAQCVEAGRCSPAPFGPGGARLVEPGLPMTRVTWYDATAYCAFVGARLPTEAEWERAARGWARRTYPWGDVYNPLLSNHGRFGASSASSLDASDGFLELAPVGSYPDGRTPDGLADLAGNAEEWVADYYLAEYPSESQRNPVGPDHGDTRVVRGGSFGHGRVFLRSAARAQDFPSSRRIYRGFRCARPADGEPRTP